MKNQEHPVVSEFMKIVQIDSLSLKEEKMFQYLEQRLAGLPIEMEFQDYHLEDLSAASTNLIVKLKANAPDRKSIFFDAHVDTVTPGIGIKPVLEGKTIRSASDTILGADDKAGVAAMIIALSNIVQSDIKHGDVYFLFTSAEEIGLIGIQHLDMTKIQANYGFILDSHGGVGGIILAAPHHYHYTIEVIGKAAHAGIEPEKGINAIHIAAQIAASLPQGKVSAKTVANIGLIDGGKATNIIADDCIIKGEFRSHSESEMEKVCQHIRDSVEKHRIKAVDLILSFERMYDGFSYKKSAPIVRLAEKAVKQVGLSPRFEVTGGGSHTNVYNQNGIASVTLAVGMNNVHSTEESIEVQDLIDLTRLIEKLIEIA